VPRSSGDPGTHDHPAAGGPYRSARRKAGDRLRARRDVGRAEPRTAGGSHRSRVHQSGQSQIVMTMVPTPGRRKGETVRDLHFENRMAKQRERLQTSPEELGARVDNSPYGPESKRILHQMVDHESTGQVGFSLFNCPPVIVRGENATVYDADGKSYIDMLAGFSVSNVGQSNAEVGAAIANQAHELIHYFDLPNEPRERLASRLSQLVPGDDRRVAFAVT